LGHRVPATINCGDGIAAAAMSVYVGGCLGEASLHQSDGEFSKDLETDEWLQAL